MKETLATIRIDGDKLLVSGDLPFAEFYLPDSTETQLHAFLSESLKPLAKDLSTARPWAPAKPPAPRFTLNFWKDDMGSFTQPGCTSKGDALWHVNSARAHDGLKPLHSLDQGKYVISSD